jgi:hypothetical protein
MDYLATHTSLSPIWGGFAPGFVNYQKECTRLTGASDKDYQLLAHGRSFSPGSPTSYTTKTGSHDIAEILLKVALKNQSINITLAYEPLYAVVCGLFHDKIVRRNPYNYPLLPSTIRPTVLPK